MKCIGAKFRFTLLIPHAGSKEAIQTDGRAFFGRSYPIIVLGAERQQALHIFWRWWPDRPIRLERACELAEELVNIRGGCEKHRGGL